METTNNYMDEMVNRAVEQQHQEYLETASDLNVWHCPSLTRQHFWSLLNATAQAIMARRGVYHTFVVDDSGISTRVFISVERLAAARRS